jgi:Uma2 family endonuclease
MTITSSGRVPMVMPADHMPGPEQGHWIYKDYAALPDDGHRYEIVDGVLYIAPSPNRSHQNTAFEIASYLRTHVKLTELGQVYIAPFDVELNPQTVVQPDVIVVLNHNLDRITETRIIGAPDLVVEVSSPGTVGYDREKKQRNYARAGVPEYWIADPWSRTVEVLSLVAGSYRSLGVFEGKAVLPSEVVPDFLVHVEQFFA